MLYINLLYSEKWQSSFDRGRVYSTIKKTTLQFSRVEWASLLILLLGIAYISPIVRLNPSLLSICNYLAVSIAGLTTMFSMRLSNNKVMLYMAILGVTSLIFSESFNLYMTAIFLSNILIVNVAAISFGSQKFSNFALSVLNRISLVIVLMELLLLYVLAFKYPPLSLNDFLSYGLDYGFSKGTTAVFLFLAIFYLWGSKNYVFLWLFVLLAAPVIMSMRMSLAALVVLLASLFIKKIVVNKKKLPNALVLLLPWVVLLILVAYQVSLNKFDRLPAYMIALDVIYENPFGLGANQYSNYIFANYQEIFLKFSMYISTGFSVIWNSAETMLGELLAAFGVLGMLLIAEYIRLHNALITMSSALTHNEKALAYTFAIMIFSIIAHDYSKLDFFYYYLVGAVIGIVQRKRRDCSV